MDGASGLAADQCAIGAHFGLFAAWAGEHFTRPQHTALDELTKGDPGFCTFGQADGQGVAVIFAQVVDPLLGNFAVCLFALNSDKVTAQHFCHSPRRACAKEWIEHHIAGVGGPKQNPVQQAFRFLRRMGLVTVFIL